MARLGKILLMTTTLLLVTLKVTEWMVERKGVSAKGPYGPSGPLTRSLRGSDQRTLMKPAPVDAKSPLRFPSGVEDRQPIAVLGSVDVQGVDEQGYVFKPFRQEVLIDLPVITGVNRRAVSPDGKALDTNLLTAVDFLRRLKREEESIYHRISEINFHPLRGLIVYFKGRAAPLVCGKNDLDWKIAVLPSVLEHFDVDWRLDKLEYLDLRFRGQVVVKSKFNTEQY